MFGIIRNGRGKKTFVGFDRQRAGLELIGVILRWPVRPMLHAHVHQDRLDGLRWFMSFLDEGCGCRTKVQSVAAA